MTPTTDPARPPFGAPFWRPGDFELKDGFPRYPEREMARRHRFGFDLIDHHDLDALVVGGSTGPLETAIQFFSNWPSQVQSYLLFRPGVEPLLLVRLWNHLPDAQRISMVEEVRYGGDTPAHQAAYLTAELARLRPSRVGLIGVVPHGDLEVLTAGLPGVAVVDLNPAYQEFRLVKTEDEMVFARIASRMNDAAVAALAGSLRPGLNEYEVAEIIESTYLGHRGWNLIHFSLSTPMADPKVWVPHQYHPDRVIEGGDVFVTEISTTFWGYAGQILRTFSIDGEPTPYYARLHQVALDTYLAIQAALLPGVTVGEILDLADNITTSGFDIWDDLVHGFGGAYLPPIIRTRASRGATHPEDHQIPDGTLLVVQPNVIDGQAGVQVGNSMWVRPGGVEVTQLYPTRLIVCA
jgi:Xaa-Pro aminopeptidase